MPPSHHMEGIQAARAIRKDHPEIGVVVLSQHTDESYARALFNDGSAGLAYLLKDRVGDLEDLVRALHEVASGGSVVDPLVVPPSDLQDLGEPPPLPPAPYGPPLV